MNSIILKNTNLITMKDDKLLEHVDVLIEDGKIIKIEANLNIEDVNVIDCSNKYIMPGLFDMHVHLESSDMINLFIANGVTAVRNMWGFKKTLEWKEEINKGKKIGPDTYTTGPLIDGKTIFEGTKVVTTPEEAKKSVLETIEDGYDYVKTYPNIPKEAFVKLMETAKKYGIKVVGHGSRTVSTDELIGLGYFSLEHSGMLPQNEEEVLKIAKSGMWFTPTQVVLWGLHKYVIKGHDVTSIDNYEYVNNIDKNTWKEFINTYKDSEVMKKFNVEEKIKLAKVFIENSEKILLGTDCKNVGVIAGFSLHDELEYLVKDLGLSPYDALKTGTVNASKSLEIFDKNGTIEEGKNANLLILDENPLIDITNTKKINSVIKKGNYYNREKLDELLENVKNIDINNLEIVK